MKKAVILLMGLLVLSMLLVGCAKTRDEPPATDQPIVDDQGYQADIEETIDQETINDDFVEIGEMI